MPIDIEGWIEVKNLDTPEWVGVDGISSYMIFAGKESDYIFGITKIPRENSLAANRGLPEDISNETKEHLDGWREFEKEESNFSFEELFGFSYITYAEILKMKLPEKIGDDNGWCKVFKKMDSLVSDKTKPENIRVVVWAIW